MQKTPQLLRRETIKEVSRKVLGTSKVLLSPVSICVSESPNDDFTVTDFSFCHCVSDKNSVFNLKSKGKGFVDGLFSGLYNHFIIDYPSLLNLKLVDLKVNPIMSKSKRLMGTDAQASVLFVVEVGKHGRAEFQHQSRSMIHSSFQASLDAFQFYVNCERAFHRIQLGLADAESRNRGDIAERCRFDLSKLTEVNTYERKTEN